MRVLVIGGTGLTGRALATSLASDGHRVFLLARGRSAAPSGLPAVVLQGDRHDAADLRAAFSECAPEAVIDQIAFAGEAVDQVASYHPARHFVCSSASVLGEGLDRREDAPVEIPYTPYLEGKLAVEARARVAGAIVLRPAYLYGRATRH